MQMQVVQTWTSQTSAGRSSMPVASVFCLFFRRGWYSACLLDVSAEVSPDGPVWTVTAPSIRPRPLKDIHMRNVQLWGTLQATASLRNVGIGSGLGGWQRAGGQRRVGTSAVLFTRMGCRPRQLSITRRALAWLCDDEQRPSTATRPIASASVAPHVLAP